MCNPCVEQGMMKEKSLNKVANAGRDALSRTEEPASDPEISE
jgi:hypothetical protein